MQAIWNWIRAEWSDPSTHMWLVAAGGDLILYLQGEISWKLALCAAIGSALGIAVPTNASTNMLAQMNYANRGQQPQGGAVSNPGAKP